MPCARLSPRDGAQSRFDFKRSTLNANEYLVKFFAKLERLVDGHGTRHAISTASTGQLEVRLGAGDWYWATQVALDDDPVRAAQAVARAEKYFPRSI